MSRYRRWRWIGPTLLVLGGTAAIALMVGGAMRKARAVPVPLERVFGDVPWIRVIPQLAPVEGVGGVRASDCGKCHQRHYDEWRTSTHAHAYGDLQFQSELGKPSSPGWLCLNCHTPVENQRQEVVQTLARGQLAAPIAKPNRAFDAVMRDEGVTCATCHVRKDDYGRSVIIGPGATSGDAAAKPPHPVRVDRAALVGRCADCHDQSYRVTPRLVCAFETGREVKEGPMAERTCASCHMPEEERPLTAMGTPVRRAHRHGFVGGPVPKEHALYDGLAATFQSALDINYDVATTAGRSTVTVQLTNARAAHRLPTGDPERAIVVEAALVDGRGAVLAREELRLGQVWQWEPEARRLDDNRLAPGERRAWTTTLAAPAPTQPARVRVSVRHVRLSPENLAYMKRTAATAAAAFAPAIAELDRHYPTETTVFESEAALDGGARTLRTQAELFARARKHDLTSQ